MKKFFRKHKKWITIICVILVTTLLVGVIAASTNVIGKISNSNAFGTRDRNPDNAFDVDLYSSLDGTRQDGIKITVDDDGVITLNGTATKDGEISLGNPTASADEYVYVGGVLDGSVDSYYFKVKPYSNSNPSYIFNSKSGCFIKPESLNPDGSLLVNIYLVYKDGTKFDNVKIYPVIGLDEVIDFYS